jgi:hypothetical protein
VRMNTVLVVAPEEAKKKKKPTSKRKHKHKAKEMKLELIPHVASGHYIHWLQLAELEKQEKSAQRMLCPTLDYYSSNSS